jgi:hypothetical protein
MDLVTYVIGFHSLLAAATGRTDHFVAAVYGPLPARNALALVTRRNGGTQTDVSHQDWTWRVAPNLTDADLPAPPRQALQDSAVIQFKTLGKRTLHSMRCILMDDAGTTEMILSVTYRCDRFR